MGVLVILMMEDSRTQALKIAANLARHGIRTIIADDGIEGLRAVHKHHPDLVIVKVNLQTLTGYQVCRRLKRDPKTAQIPVFITGLAEDEDVVEGPKVKADGYIPKDVLAKGDLTRILRDLKLAGSTTE